MSARRLLTLARLAAHAWNLGDCHARQVCGHDVLVEAEYRTGEFRAPALECAKCRALDLDERAAKSETDRDSVRRALAARQSTGPCDSGTHQTRTGSIDVARVDSAMSGIDVHLAEARIALEFASRVAEGEIGKSVADARRAVRNAQVVSDGLRKSCARATMKEDETAAKKGVA